MELCLQCTNKTMLRCADNPGNLSSSCTYFLLPLFRRDNLPAQQWKLLPRQQNAPGSFSSPCQLAFPRAHPPTQGWGSSPTPWGSWRRRRKSTAEQLGSRSPGSLWCLCPIRTFTFFLCRIHFQLIPTTMIDSSSIMLLALPLPIFATTIVFEGGGM